MISLSKLFPLVAICLRKIYRFLLIVSCSCFFYSLVAATLNVGVRDGEEATMDPENLTGNYNKIGGGTLIWTSEVSLDGDLTVSEGTQVNYGELRRSLTVRSGAIYRSPTVGKIVYNDGDLQTSKVDDPSPHSLDLTSFFQTSRTTSVLSIKVFPNGSNDPKDYCDYLSVTDALLTGNLNVYVAPGSYDHGGVRYPIIRSSVPSSIMGDFISLVNVNNANVMLTHQEDALNYYLIVSGDVPYVTPTPTSYTSGRPLNITQRHDQLVIGSTGGLEIETPEEWCRVLQITFIQTGTPAEQSTIPTTISVLPSTVEELWLVGNPKGYERLVEGGRQFALPTPAAGTRIRFAFTESPASNPLAWFQDDLPASCGVVIEQGSADPFINTVLPLRGGYMIVGAPISFGPGVAGLLVDSSPFSIQKHPSARIEDCSITLTEDTAFPGLVAGIKLEGPYSATFKAIDPKFKTPYHSLFNISQETAAARIRAFGCTVKLYREPNYVMPEVNSEVVNGNVLVVPDSIASAHMPKIPQLKTANSLAEFS